MPSDSGGWLVYGEGGKTVGPVSTSLLVQGVQEGKVASNAFVRRSGEKWRRIDEIGDLMNRITASGSRTAQAKGKKGKKKKKAPREKPAVFQSTIPYEAGRIRAAAMYCSDGRFGEQIDDFLHNGLSLPRYDRVAIPGGPACLSDDLRTFLEGRDAEEKLSFLVNAHDLQTVVLIAHAGCAYYLQRLQVSADAVERSQRRDLAKAIERVARMKKGLRVDAYLAQPVGSVMRFDPL